MLPPPPANIPRKCSGLLRRGWRRLSSSVYIPSLLKERRNEPRPGWGEPFLIGGMWGGACGYFHPCSSPVGGAPVSGGPGVGGPGVGAPVSGGGGAILFAALVSAQQLSVLLIQTNESGAALVGRY